MTNKTKYSILTAIILIAVYGINFFQDKEIKDEAVSVGELPKEATKTFFLPTSTTGQIVHHNGYSLSYNETYEQAEWVAYELKKEHLSKNDFKRPYFEIDNGVIIKNQDTIKVIYVLQEINVIVKQLTTKRF